MAKKEGKKLRIGTDTLVQVQHDDSVVIYVFHTYGHIESDVQLEPKQVVQLVKFLQKTHKEYL